MFDPLTNSCFKADIEILRKAENVLNKRMRDEMVITVNDFLQEMSCFRDGVGGSECRISPGIDRTGANQATNGAHTGEKTVEVVGEKKEQVIRDAVARDKLEKAQVTSREFISTSRWS